MKANLSAVIGRVAKFLNKTISSKDIEDLKIYLNIENMRKNPAVNNEREVELRKQKNSNIDSNLHFIGSGLVGNYKAFMTPELEKQIDEWTQLNIANRDYNLL